MSPIWDEMNISHTVDDAIEFIKFRYFRSSYYEAQMKMLKRDVPKENIFVYKFEDMVKNPKQCLNKCFKFMGVKKVEVPEATKNPTVRKKGEDKLKPSTRQFIQNNLVDDIAYYNFVQSGEKYCF